MICAKEMVGSGYKGMWVRNENMEVVRPATQADYMMTAEGTEVPKNKDLNLGMPKQTGGGRSDVRYSPQAMMKDIDNPKAIICQNGEYVEKYTF